MGGSKNKKTFHVRIVDDYGEDRHTIYSVRFVQKEGENIIRVQNLVQKGAHESLLLGLSLNGLFQWLGDVDHEIYDDVKKEWRRSISITELMELHLFGGDRD